MISVRAFANLNLSMINQHEWLQTRKNLLEQVKSQVQIRLGPLPDALRRYAKGLDNDFRRSWRPSTHEELGRALIQARVVLSADFHAYAQSQRAHVRLLRDYLGQDALGRQRRVVVALECLDYGQNHTIQDFLRGAISESRFLDLVGWEKNWGFPWENYRPLFELARDRGFAVRGLNPGRTLTLKKRDDWTAAKILGFLKEDPGALVFVVIGEWHLASSHLPLKLRKSLKNRSDLAIVHQDNERLYFKLAAKKQESGADILRSSTAQPNFCLMVSPPWMKWQSYLMYLEQAYDRDLQEDLAIDYTDHVVSLIQVLETDLKAEIKKSNVQVYCPNSRTPLARLRLSLSAKQEKALVYYVENDLSFYIPQRGWLYLSRPTINHASSLAGMYVHGVLAKRKRTLWNLPDDFLPLIWVEAVGFLFSKWINPKRKAETLDSIRLELAARHPKDKGREALLLALDHRLSEVLWVRTGRLRRSRFKPRQMSAYLDAARILGSMLGERLFQKVRSRTISLAKLMSYLRVNVEGASFVKFYWRLIRETEPDQAR